MKITSIFLIVISAFCLPVESIINGTFIAVKEAPYFVTIVVQFRDVVGSSFCAGTIISENWIVTAGHCVEAFLMFGVSSIGVFSGATIASVHEGKAHPIEKVIVHGDYSYMYSGSVDSDIALIKLKEPIKFNENEQPMKISSVPPKIGDRVQLIGVGKQGRARGTAIVLKTTEVNVISRETCQEKMLPYHVTNSVFCAGDVTADSCNGDSGGPVVLDGKLTGIVSWGLCDGYLDKPGAYTRIHLFYNWILEQTGIKD